jgi:hypothetical protein
MDFTIKPPTGDEWLADQLEALGTIFSELAVGVRVHCVRGWPRTTLEHCVRRLLPDVERLAKDAGLGEVFWADHDGEFVKSMMADGRQRSERGESAERT